MATRPLRATPPEETFRGVVLAVLISRVSILLPIARWTVARGTATFLTTPPDTSNRVTGFAWRKISAFRRGSTRTDVTFVPTNRFVGTKTYCASFTTTGLPE